MKPLLLTSTAQAPEPPPPAPRIDYLELARLLDADISYPPPGGGLVAQIERKTASDWRQAWATAQRRDVSVYLSLSEKVGVPLALFGSRRIPHVMIAHNLTSPRKRMLQKRFHWLQRVQRILVLSRTQERYLREEVGLPAEQVRFLYYEVDSTFWKPEIRPSQEKPLILSVGKERRDYETLRSAARLLPEVTFILVASSPWSRSRNSADSGEVPANVIVRRGLPWPELRELYASASVVVVPLEPDTEYAAGVNGVLEAMAMGKPLIVTLTPGIADYLKEGTNARTVPPADPTALAGAITALLAHPEEAACLGRNARAEIEGGRNLDTYLNTVTQIVREVAP